MNKIAIYAICRNELQFVDKGYESMREADLIAVLDTGSTDGTYERFLELAKNDDKLIVSQKTYTPWRFDTPRNDCMDLVPREYNILMSTDLDEILEPGWADILRTEWVEGTHTRAQYKYTWSHQDDGSEGRTFAYNKIHDGAGRWHAPVHELLCRDGSEMYLEEEELDLFNKVHLHHYPDQTKSRSNYLPLLELRKQETPDDFYGRIYLAHEYYYRDEYQKSIDEFKEILEIFKDNPGMHGIEEASCYLFMGDCYMELENYPYAIMSYYNAIAIEPTYREPYINLGNVYIKLEMYDAAISIVKDGLRKSYRHYTWLERDNSWSWEPWDTLSIAAYGKGDRINGLAGAVKALNYCPTDKRLISNLQYHLDAANEDNLI